MPATKNIGSTLASPSISKIAQSHSIVKTSMSSTLCRTRKRDAWATTCACVRRSKYGAMILAPEKASTKTMAHTSRPTFGTPCLKLLRNECEDVGSGWGGGGPTRFGFHGSYDLFGLLCPPLLPLLLLLSFLSSIPPSPVSPI